MFAGAGEKLGGPQGSELVTAEASGLGGSCVELASSSCALLGRDRVRARPGAVRHNIVGQGQGW